jgi:hypothetical protein
VAATRSTGSAAQARERQPRASGKPQIAIFEGCVGRYLSDFDAGSPDAGCGPGYGNQ